MLKSWALCYHLAGSPDLHGAPTYVKSAMPEFTKGACFRVPILPIVARLLNSSFCEPGSSITLQLTVSSASGRSVSEDQATNKSVGFSRTSKPASAAQVAPRGRKAAAPTP